MGIDLARYKTGNVIGGKDLAGREVTVTIEDVTERVFVDSKTKEEERRLLIGFAGRDGRKYCKVNKTSLSSMLPVLGADTDAWVGKRVKLIPRPTNLGMGLFIEPA